MNTNTKKILIIFLILFSVGFGFLSIYIGTQIDDVAVSDQEDDATRDFYERAGQVCGETCNTDADCRGSTVPQLQVGCRNVAGTNRCINIQCPGNTAYGSRCDCLEAPHGCGERCGTAIGLCKSPFSCTFASKSTCGRYPEDAYCVPAGTGFVGGKGPIPDSWFTDSTERFARAACASTGMTDLYTASGNNFIYHPSQGTDFNRIWTQQEVKEFICSPRVEAACGDGQINQDAEQCEIGNEDLCNGNTVCNLTTCICDLPEPVCGNMLIEVGEECEAGFTDVCATGLTCNTATCLCESPNGVCGNGILDPGEDCDDSNLVSGDGCSNQCRSTVACSDGVDNDIDGLSDEQDPGCWTSGVVGVGEYLPQKNSEIDAISDVPASAIFNDERDNLVYASVFLVLGILLIKGIRRRKQFDEY